VACQPTLGKFDPQPVFLTVCISCYPENRQSLIAMPDESRRLTHAKGSATAK
jgi:hypothetical protein